MKFYSIFAQVFNDLGLEVDQSLHKYEIQKPFGLLSKKLPKLQKE